MAAVSHQPPALPPVLSPADFADQSPRRIAHRLSLRTCPPGKGNFSPQAVVLENRALRRLHHLLHLFSGSLSAFERRSLLPCRSLSPAQRHRLSGRRLGRASPCRQSLKKHKKEPNLLRLFSRFSVFICCLLRTYVQSGLPPCWSNPIRCHTKQSASQSYHPE